MVPLLAAAALVLAACGDGTAGDQNQSTAGPTSDDTLTSSLDAYNDAPIGGRFSDAERGALVRARCAADSCTYQLVRTEDGGATWSVSAIPGAPVTSAPLDDAHAAVLPGGQVVTEIQVGADRPARHTADGGKTWPAHNAAPLGVTDKVPSNGALVGWCSQSVDCAEPFLRVILPSGASASFGPPPAELTETVRATRVADGSIWVQGRDGVGRVLLAVSRSNGTEWTTNRVPAPASSNVDIVGTGELAWVLSLSEDSGGGTGGTAPGAPARKLRQSLLYSQTAGASFDSVKLPEEYRLNTGSGIGVTDAGDAVISSDGRVAVISPSGQVTPVNDVKGAVYDLGPQILVHGPGGSWVSADAKTWSPLPKG
ncbi:hypothetical protein [Cryptosporangium aurantiacum]|uniref:hypothetical protein n=1 Tax=Cryptosporangium aurantiacum TaxID=134849 RepID=UPI000934D06F|nr:hypothetical protein [Cryptosporangium aurantiacum]